MKCLVYSELLMTEKTNQTLALVVISFFVIGGVLFTLDQPYWYLSIFFFTIGILIIIVKTMWRIAGWADDTLQGAFDKDPKIEVSFKIDPDFSKKRICPKCGSEDISSTYSEKTSSLECDDCNFKWSVKNE